MSNLDDRVRNVYAPPTKPSSAHNPPYSDPTTWAELALLSPEKVTAELDRRARLEKLNAYLQASHIGFRCMLAAAGERGRRRRAAREAKAKARAEKEEAGWTLIGTTEDGGEVWTKPAEEVSAETPTEV